MPNVAQISRRAAVRRAAVRLAAARLAVALLPAAVLAACGGDGDATGPRGVTGVYALQSVEGQPLPVQIGETDDVRPAYISAGSVELRSDNRYSASLTVRVGAGAQGRSQDVPDQGTYTVSGSSVTLVSTDGSSTTATVNGGQLTSQQELGGVALTFVFKK